MRKKIRKKRREEIRDVWNVGRKEKRKGRRLLGGRVEGGGWRGEGGGGRVERGGWRGEGGEGRVERGGWRGEGEEGRVERGGRRV